MKELAEIKNIVDFELKKRRNDLGIEEIFMTRPDFKITMGWITPSGALTAKATREIYAIVGNEISSQRQYRERQNILKIRCLENEIEPTLIEDCFGNTFFEDDQVFDEKLNHLIGVELQRMRSQ